MSDNIIRDVVFRTNGEMYIGVVGAVRSGKSMFIRKFIEEKVLHYIDEEEIRNKVIDDLPQSAEGSTIMTVEPKFVPSNSANITLEDGLKLSIRLVDCVGYVIPSAKGYMNEDKTPRLVRTPWFSENIPFEEAASIGTKKVIENHSNIGIVLTSDGSFGEFSRKEYEKVEFELIDEMQSLEKPFVIVLNTIFPNSEATRTLVKELEGRYQTAVVPVNVAGMTSADIDKILKEALSEFDISKLEIRIPTWIRALGDNHEIKKEFNEVIEQTTGEFRKFKHVSKMRDKLSECRLFEEVNIASLDSGTGEVEIEINCNDELYRGIVHELIGDIMEDKGKFITFLQESMHAKKEYDYYKGALESVKATGYGIAIPRVDDMILQSPEVIKQGTRYGVKLNAVASSIHMIKVDVESTFEPIIGTEEQSRKFIEQIMEDYEGNTEGIWNLEIFGRKLSEVVNDGIKSKLYLVPETCQYKFRESLEKIVNKGKGGILAFIL